MAWITMSFDSEALHMPVMLDILLPQGNGNYKSLYLLHGAGGDHSSWITRTRIADYVDHKNIAVIMPSGNNKCYVNNVHGKDYYTFVTEELIKKCEIWFSISSKKQDRYIAGMSMGGYGAFYAALENPDLYQAAFSYSGVLQIIDTNNFGLDFYPVFGSEKELLTRNFDLIEKVHNYKNQFHENVDNVTEFYLECGLSDKILAMSDVMYHTMRDDGYIVKYQTGEGEHEWDYWDQCVKKTINIISQNDQENCSSSEVIDRGSFVCQ